MSTFLLKIEVGNSAMSNGYDISNALLSIANKLQYVHEEEIKGIGGIVHDINGNVVGNWKVTGKSNIIEVD